MNELNIDTFWQRVKKLCQKQNLTLQTLADKCGTTRMTIYRQITKNVPPNIRLAYSISAVLGVSLDYLVCDDDTNPLKDKNDEYKKTLSEIYRIASQN